MSHALGRRWRPIAIFLAGTLTGGLLLLPALGGGSTASAATYTRSVSCAGSSFYPTDSDTAFAMNGTARTRPVVGGSGLFRCDPGLPHGGVVTALHVTVVDSSIGGSVGPCTLSRHGLQTATSTQVDVLASVPASGFAPGTVRLTDSTISFATIDNSKYAYWLECSIAGGALFIGLIGADVSFTITAAKG